jgi:hypothetical protein
MIRRRALAAALGLIALGAFPASASADFGFLPGAEGVRSVSLTSDEPHPEMATLAGSHPYQTVTEFKLNMGGESGGIPYTDGDLRSLEIDMPPGYVENPSALHKCTQAEFHTPRVSPYWPTLSGEDCSKQSQIGTVTIHSDVGGGSTRTFGVFNLEPPPGAPSAIGFSPYGVPIEITPRLREAGGSQYGLTLNLHDFPQQFDLYGLRLAIWGIPWSASHDDQRGNCLNEVEPLAAQAKCSAEAAEIFESVRPYVSLPTNCEEPLSVTVRATSWQQPGVVQRTTTTPPLTDCEHLTFRPKPTALLSSNRTTTPSGFDFTLEGNSSGLLDPNARAGSQVRNVSVSLPEGLTVNPSVGAGLGVCTGAEFAAEQIATAPGAGCPNASTLGHVTVETPLVEGALEGSMFLATPDDPATGEPGAENPFDSLLALYLVARSPERGVIVKVSGRVDPDPTTGRLVATFVDLPQMPYSRFNVHFRDGQRSLLATPSTCSVYQTGLDATSWLGSTEHVDSPFQLTKGIGGTECPTGLAPFAPTSQAGTLNRQAGSYTSFYLQLDRSDADQEFTSYSSELPPGLLGKIAGIPYCPESAIAAAKRKSGLEEAEHPSCPAASKIGHTVSGYGLGSDLAYATGSLYLAGPYHGQPISVIAINSANIGPFDLGVVTVRSAIRVEPLRAQVSIDSAGSDPIPHIVAGIPIHLRDIRVYIDRPNFMLNPTSCENYSANAVMTGSGASFGNPADDDTATAPYPFQVSNCSSLQFQPRLSINLKGGTTRGDFPQLTAIYRPRPGDANVGNAAVTLPKTVFLAQQHIGTACTRVQFAAHRCPANSVYGNAEAITPLLSEPLTGPVYLRSSNDVLPEMVADLKGGGVEIEVVGRIDAPHGGLRGRFEVLPDAPVTKFMLKLKGGKHGVIQLSRNICAQPQFAAARMIGQNNVGDRWTPLLHAECNRKNGKRGRR